MTTLSSFGGGVKSIQTAYVNGTTWTDYGSAGTEDGSYLDITVDSVDSDKCVVMLDMVAANLAYPTISTATTAYISFQMTGRMTSATNLRLSCARASAAYLPYGRYTVVEYY